jgi:tetratricopeptide (TPR) repeat protein
MQYVKLGQFAKADTALLKGVQKAAGFGLESLAWQAWIGTKMDQDSMMAAMKLAQKAIEKASETSDGYVTRAMAYSLQGDTAKSLEAGRRAIELDPNNVIALKIATRELYQAKKYREIVAITQGLKLKAWQPNMEADVYNITAMAYNNLGQHDSAFAVIRRTIALDTLYGTPYSTLAETYAFVGNKRDFFSNLEKSFQLGMRFQAVDWTESPYNRFQKDPKARMLREKYGKR